MMRIGILLICAVLLLCAGCSAQNALKSRAAQYYNLMLGVTPKLRYSSFLSPAYKASVAKPTLDEMDQIWQGKKIVNKQYKPLQPAMVAVAQDGRYAITVASSENGTAFTRVGAIRWVRVGGKWYRYMFSAAETKAYGSFPVGLAAPAPPPPAGKQGE